MRDTPSQLPLPSLPTSISDNCSADVPLTVKSVSSKGPIKRLKLTDGSQVQVHRFACVGEKDTVIISGEDCLSVKTEDGDVKILPRYQSNVSFDVAPGKRIFLETHEISTQAQYDAYDALSQYHYRNQNSFGRRAILLLTSRDLDFPQALGFIEITTAFVNLRNRSELFNAHFEAEPGRPVEWSNWDKATRDKYINIIARISRMVVHPEVRGIGLSRVLITEAEKFCKERWNVNNRKALFLEITADMLKFMPFVYGAKMHNIGVSSGNLDRVVKDMKYLEKIRNPKKTDVDGIVEREDHWINRKESKGIATKQRQDIDAFLSLKGQFEDERKDIFIELSRITEGDGDVDAETYELLMPLVRFPKPTFMKGLTKRSDAFVKRRCVELGLQTKSEASNSDVAPCTTPLRVRNLNLEFNIDTGALGATDPGQIRRAFGLTRQFSFRTGIKDLTFDVDPGEICYVYGSSGSGKTSLLNLISNGVSTENYGTISGQISIPSDARLGFLETEWPRKPLVVSIGAKDIDHAINALNTAGLAEPRLYLSSWDQLSAGQKYRAQLARLICSDTNVWLLDEFASNLDDATALSVGKNFSRAARKQEVICFIASIRRTPLVNSISPDLLVQLNQVGNPVVSRDWRTFAGGSNV